MPPRRRAVTIITGKLQLAQVLWLTLNPATYDRHRGTVTILQRLRWMATAAGSMRSLPTKHMFEAVYFERTVRPATLGAFLMVACLLPM